MSKKNDLFREQLQQAVKQVRQEANGQGDFYHGMQSGASMVAVRLSEIQRQYEAEKKLVREAKTKSARSKTP